jgi:hypothetical protein
MSKKTDRRWKNYREDDTNWPKKNIVGKQELEIRVGNDHISFEVRISLEFIYHLLCR